MTKALPYLVLVCIALGIVAVYLLLTNKKDMKAQTGILNDQSTLLVAWAKKFDSTLADIPEVKEVHEEKEHTTKPTLEEEDALIGIVDKICFGIPLTLDEEKLKKRFLKIVTKEADKYKSILKSLIDKFLTDAKEFDQTEKDFYEDNQEAIDQIVRDKKCHASVIKKIIAGQNDFTEEELQYQKNFPKAIESELAEIKKKEEKMNKSNPPNAANERLKIILKCFDDGIPKTVTALSKLYAEATNSSPNKGNASIIFGQLVESGQLACQKASRGKPVYHGLPSWFENGKLKPEYLEKVA